MPYAKIALAGSTRNPARKPWGLPCAYCVRMVYLMEEIMNVNLYNRVKAALNTDRPKVQGYKNLSLSDIETVLMCVDAGIPLNYATAEARRLYQDLVG